MRKEIHQPITEDYRVFKKAELLMQRGLKAVVLQPAHPVRGIKVFDSAFTSTKGDAVFEIGSQVLYRDKPTDEREEVRLFIFAEDFVMNAQVRYRKGLIDPNAEPEEDHINTDIAVEKAEAFINEYEGLITHPQDYPSRDVLYRQGLEKALEPWKKDVQGSGDQNQEPNGC